MADTLTKLRPDRDLQCYFERPSAIAALSDTAPDRFTVSGTWRQQFDWAVIEWNRDNVFEHPALRCLPDGDFRGLTLEYEESRNNCIVLDSDLYPTVDWPYLRVWADDSGEPVYHVPLSQYATPIHGNYSPAHAVFELEGQPNGGDYVGLSWLSEHHTYRLYGGDRIEDAVQALANSVNAFSPWMKAHSDGSRLTVYYVGEGQTMETSTAGANGNRIGGYTFIAGSGQARWKQAFQMFTGGTSPDVWRIRLPFDQLIDRDGRSVPVSRIRKLRWTYSADMQAGAYQRTEFAVSIRNWRVSGREATYYIAGPGSVRIEDTAPQVEFEGPWTKGAGNFSGGSIHFTTTPGASVSCECEISQPLTAYLGTRYAAGGAAIEARIDGDAVQRFSLHIPGEDVLARIPLLQLAPGHHQFTFTHQGQNGEAFYFDFLELANPVQALPTFLPKPRVTLATDWDTDHSIALAPERTAWLIQHLGYLGRANHYVGALWFYDLYRPGHQYASTTVEFSGRPEPSAITALTVGLTTDPPEKRTTISHLNRIGDTAETLAVAFALELNRGYTAIRAEVDGPRLTIISRAMGVAGNDITVAAGPTTGEFTINVASGQLQNGRDGEWRTDLSATPRINRAARDWSRSFYQALARYGIDVCAAFSTELQHGDPTLEAGIAQRYPDGDPVLVNTPALQTNFSAISLAYWKDVYRGMAQVMSEAGVQPYLQFGEVQWWYFPNGSGLTFYDEETKTRFAQAFGRPLPVFRNGDLSPGAYPAETAFLARQIGEFTRQIQQHVLSEFPTCRFEVLYPTDVNHQPFMEAVNFASEHWTPETLTCLKTESFTFTYMRDMNASQRSMRYGIGRGFSPSRRSHLVGISDPNTAWPREAKSAVAEQVESVVLFALDQYCLVGYPERVLQPNRRSVAMGSR